MSGKTTQPTTAPYALSSLTPLYRFRADSYGYSYSTSDIGRADQSNQGVRAYVHPNRAAGTVPFYRFRNADRYYFYSTAPTPAQGWVSDGIAFYIYPAGQAAPPGAVPLHMFHNPKGFFYTTDQSEGFGIGYTYDGVSGYIHNTNPLVPVAPSNLYWSGGTLHWRDNSSNETGFKIEQFSAAGGSWSEIATVGANVTSYSGAAGKACRDHFRVRAYSGTLHSNYSGVGGAGQLTGDGESCIHAVPFQHRTSPSVTLVSPTDGAVFKAGTNVQLKAEAFDAQGSGTIAKVEFFLQSGMKIGEATRPPYTISGGSAPAGTYTVVATATDAGGLSAASPPVTITVQPVAAGDVTISEFRFRGTTSPLDEFVELYNNTDFAITVSTTDGSGGWSLVGSDGSVRFTIPNGTIIPARGHYLGVNVGAYSLGAYAPADAGWVGDIADGAGVGLFKSSSPSNFTADYRLDAVGFNSVADVRFREGVGLQPAAGVNVNSEFSLHAPAERRYAPRHQRQRGGLPLRLNRRDYFRRGAVRPRRPRPGGSRQPPPAQLIFRFRDARPGRQQLHPAEPRA